MKGAYGSTRMVRKPRTRACPVSKPWGERLMRDKGIAALQAELHGYDGLKARVLPGAANLLDRTIAGGQSSNCGVANGAL